MSRCFPYPPPGYVCNRAAGDALINSIKIEKENIKREKKEHKRREKELKKKEKKEKERLMSSIKDTDGANKRKRHCDGFDNSVKKSGPFDSGFYYIQKKIEAEAEQLERSSLTEEYGQPIVSGSLCYSSDGTQSKTKKSQIEQSPSHESRTTQGKVIRFRLKQRVREDVHPTDIPSTSGRTDDGVTKVNAAYPSKEVRYAIPKSDVQLAFSAPSVNENSAILPTCSLQANIVSKPKSAYESLLCEWVPPPIHFNAMVDNDDDDENWLLPCKKRAAKDMAILESNYGLSGRQSVSLQPCAHLLPEVDLYVLPYAVPF